MKTGYIVLIVFASLIVALIITFFIIQDIERRKLISAVTRPFLALPTTNPPIPDAPRPQSLPISTSSPVVSPVEQAKNRNSSRSKNKK